MKQKFRIRYNKSAGQPGRGSIDHKWRVFDEEGKEYICKEVYIHPASWTEKDRNGNDYNIVTFGEMRIEKKYSAIEII